MPAFEPVAEDDQVVSLLFQWRSEAAAVSSSTRMQQHPANFELIALGLSALPAIFRDLEKTQDGHLSRTLTAITGASPVPSELRGRIAEIAGDWLDWARESDDTAERKLVY